MTQSKFLRNSIHGMLAGLGSTLGAFFGGVVVARVLGTEGAGTVAFAMWLVTTISSCGDLGLPAVLARFLPELVARGEKTEAFALGSFLFLRMLLITAVILASFVALVLLAEMTGAAEHLIGNTVRSNWASIASLLATQLLYNYGTGYLKGFQRFATLARLNIISALAQFLTILIGSITFGVRGVLFGYLVGNVILLTVLRTVLRQRGPIPKDIPKELKRRVWRYALRVWGATIVSAITWSRVEIFFLERSWGNTEVGLFSASLAVATLATQGPMLMTSGFLPYFAERYGVGDIPGLRRAYRAATRVLAFLLLPACLGTAAIAPKLIPLLFGRAFVPAVPSAMIVSSVAGLAAIGGIAALLLNTMERTGIILLFSLVGAALSIAAGLTIIPAFGIDGAAASRTIVQLIMLASGFWYVARRLGCPLPLGDVGRIFLAALSCALVARLTLETVAGLWSMPAAIVSGAMSYFVVLHFIGGLPKEDIALLERWALGLPKWSQHVVNKCIWLIAA
jgi:O-antigen/teichoic acid export membrane protein